MCNTVRDIGSPGRDFWSMIGSTGRNSVRISVQEVQRGYFPLEGHI